MTTHEVADIITSRNLQTAVRLGFDVPVTHASGFDGAKQGALVWMKGNRDVHHTKAAIIIMEMNVLQSLEILMTPTTYIGVYNPRLEFALTANELFPEKGFIGDEVYHHQARLVNMVTDGFGWVRGHDGKLIKFPHYGKIKVHPTATIAPSARIARAALGETIVEEGVAIDNMVHIAHGAHIGAHTSIAALTCIEGSVKIGQRCTIGSNVTFQIGSGCGDDVTVGSGSVVTKHIPNGETWVGVPARKIK